MNKILLFDETYHAMQVEKKLREHGLQPRFVEASNYTHQGCSLGIECDISDDFLNRITEQSCPGQIRIIDLGRKG